MKSNGITALHVCFYFLCCIVALYVSIAIHGLNNTQRGCDCSQGTNQPPGFGVVILMSEHVSRMCSHMGRSVTSTLQSKALNRLNPINNNNDDKDQIITIKL